MFSVFYTEDIAIVLLMVLYGLAVFYSPFRASFINLPPFIKIQHDVPMAIVHLILLYNMVSIGHAVSRVFPMNVDSAIT
jgi:hypothetical protein